MNISNDANEIPVSGAKSEQPSGKTDGSDLIADLLKIYPGAKDTLIRLAVGITSAAAKVASKATEVQTKVEKAVSSVSESSGLREEVGAYLKDLREVAGLTIKDVSDAMKLPDQSLLAAAEKGTAALSFELILRLAALLARHDPIPFVIRLTRTYNPELWAMLESWGLGKLPLHLERERRFINIYRRHDAARDISDASFERILEFTGSAFEMALKFALNREPVSGESADPPDETGGN